MIRIFDNEMNEIDLSQYGLEASSFKPSSLSPNHAIDNYEGMDGVIRTGTDLDVRKCEVDFRLKAYDFNIHSLYRSDVFDLFDPTRDLYVVQEEQMGKRWHVVVSSEWTPDRINPSVSKFTVPFETYRLPYAESINKSLTPKTFNEFWQIGMGLIPEDTPYTFSSKSFRVYNAGNVVVNPIYCDMQIIIKATASGYIQLKNETTGDIWRYDGALTNNDTLIVDFRAKKNGLSVYRSTNKGIITLAAGWNEFSVTGASAIHEITFDFRYYYKG